MVEWYDQRITRRNTIERLFEGLTEYFNHFLESEEDLPYWHTERSLVGHLVQAAAYKKMLTVEAYSLIPEGNQRRFRPDLWLVAPDGENIQIVFEAKRSHRSFSYNINSMSTVIETKITNAHEQIMNWGLEGDEIEGDKICCILFLPIYCHTNLWPDNNEEYERNRIQCIESFQNVCEQLGANIVSFSYSYFPERDVVHQFVTENGYYYPGILVAGLLRNW